MSSGVTPAATLLVESNGRLLVRRKKPTIDDINGIFNRDYLIERQQPGLSPLGGYIDWTKGFPEALEHRLSKKSGILVQIPYKHNEHMQQTLAAEHYCGIISFLQTETRYNKWNLVVATYLRDDHLDLDALATVGNRTGNHLEVIDTLDIILGRHEHETLYPELRWLALAARSQNLLPLSALHVPDRSAQGAYIEGFREKEQQLPSTEIVEPTAKAVVGMPTYNPWTNRWLLQKRARGSKPGTWGLLGGKIDPGEEYAQARIREFLEEAYGKKDKVTDAFIREKANHIQYMGLVGIWGTYTPPGKFYLNPVSAIITDLDDFTPDPTESADLRWVTREEAQNLPMLTNDTLEAMDATAAALKKGRFYPSSIIRTPQELIDHVAPHMHTVYQGS